MDFDPVTRILSLVPNWQLWAGVLTAVVAAGAALSALRNMVTGKSEVVERLERAVGRGDLRDRIPTVQQPEIARMLQPLSWLAKPTKAAELSRVRARLIQAGYRGPHALERYLVVKVVLAAVATVVVLQINARLPNRLTFPLDIAVGVWTCAAAFFFPNVWLSLKGRDRRTQIERGLPDAMDLLVTCVEAGLGIDAAIARVSEEIGLASQILGAELNVTFLEVQAGITRPDAFRRLAERTGVEDLRTLAAMLIQTEMFGTSVARALRVHADGMRVKRMQRAEEKAAMTGVKMTIPLIMCILPSLIAVLLGPAMVSIIQVLLPNMSGNPGN
jgi:tight adherence protein C